MSPIRVQTLGRLRCLSDDLELSDLPAQRLRCAVLIYLAVEGQATRETVASLLWPERSDERARHALSQKLYELRQLLGEEWLDAQGDRLRVLATLEIDTRTFEQTLARGAIEAALDLYQGEFLSGFYLPQKNFEMWVDRQRARLGRLHRDARRQLIERCWLSGEHERALLHARRWAELEPHEDEAQHRLIELLALSGLRAEAIRHYESYERSLRAEELEPLADTRELMTRIRQSNAAADRGVLQQLPGRAAATVSSSRAPSRMWSGPGRGILLALALLLVLAGGWLSTLRSGAGARGPTIAVLPFRNLSADKVESQHLSEGIADELITALSHAGGLRVAARTSSFRFKTSEIDVKAIADSLDVALVIEGTIRKDGDRLRVAAQLVKAEDGFQLWSRAFDREFTDALAVQQEIAREIVAALQLPGEKARLALGSTTNTRAFDAYLRGRYLLHRGTRTAVRGAISSFDSAIAHDPSYALAHANRAEAYVIAAATREFVREEALQTAAAAAQRAIALEPGLAEAHGALARIQLERWQWDDAEREAALAIRLDPRNAAAHATYARLLLVRGRLRDAVREAELASQLEPLAATIANTYAEALRAVRKYHASARAYRRGLQLEPDLGHQNLAKLYIEMGQYDSAQAEFTAAFAAGAPRMRAVPLLWDAYIKARQGMPQEALTLLSEFQDRQPRGPNGYLIAALYLAVGDREQAFALAELGVRDRSQAAWRQLPWDPIWDPVRSDPRFKRLLQEMGL